MNCVCDCEDRNRERQEKTNKHMTSKTLHRICLETQALFLKKIRGIVGDFLVQNVWLYFTHLEFGFLAKAS